MAGPIAALVLARVIEKRPRSGVAVALGGALSETIYCFLAFWGFASILNRYPSVVPISQGVTAPILLALGINIVSKKSEQMAEEEPPPCEKLKGSFILGLTITGLNPLILAGWAAAVAAAFSLGLVSSHPAHAFPFAISAGLGVMGWFAVLVFVIEKNRHRFSTKTLERVMRVIGVVIICFALWVGWLAICHVL